MKCLKEQSDIARLIPLICQSLLVIHDHVYEMVRTRAYIRIVRLCQRQSHQIQEQSPVLEICLLI